MIEGYINLETSKGELVDYIQGKIDELPGQAELMVGDISDIYEGFMRDEAPVKWGNLQNSVTAEMISPLESIIYPDIYYAVFVIQGTKPHDIYPLGGNITYMGSTIREGRHALYWEGAWYPVAHVHHPGTQPNDFPQRAFDRGEGLVDARIEEFLSWFAD